MNSLGDLIKFAATFVMQPAKIFINARICRAHLRFATPEFSRSFYQQLRENMLSQRRHLSLLWRDAHFEIVPQMGLQPRHWRIECDRMKLKLFYYFQVNNAKHTFSSSKWTSRCRINLASGLKKPITIECFYFNYFGIAISLTRFVSIKQIGVKQHKLPYK